MSNFKAQAVKIVVESSHKEQINHIYF
ncbi:hypothetical protein DFA_04787 [Cavenderia fasciculata]|uniref:Uncharacterized protein n=1 Tax=Cavenderia fasciculata TaxID=261658 RepID=F4PQJ4_CACFS|nr:hypothetical protein DFA_04787 [Cavenderia fasciculata]EGG22657.1 hypothetical protein DFA_04787 [Cavenderia fasciculata]|eukprot:XP_004360508.1 hypothetical protein DFA_04787 [Cavenderia fasciculata]